jgi:hypothetical protein
MNPTPAPSLHNAAAPTGNGQSFSGFFSLLSYEVEKGITTLSDKVEHF